MSRVVSMPVAEWPEADAFMWQRLTVEGGPLDEGGALAHLREASLNKLRYEYGRWLEWLFQSQAHALAEPPAARATVERLLCFVEALGHVAPMTRLMLVEGPLRVISAAAPYEDWSKAFRLREILRRNARATFGTRKNGRVLSSAVLLKAGLKLAGAGAEVASTPLESARRRRDGTMVAFLTLLPMRRRAFAELRIGSSVCITLDCIVVSLSGAMTKNHLPWEAAVPHVIEPALRRYIDEVRPFLMARRGAEHDFLWVNEYGRPFDLISLSLRFRQVTLRATGVPISPHLFRDAAATTLSRLSPENARLIRPLLAHSSYETAERHYIQAQGIETGRDYASVLAALKGEQR